jgi:16S rRNA (cytosine967-C5)-methyltransferase
MPLPRLSDLAPAPTRWSPVGLRIRLSADAKSPAIHAELAYHQGQIEIQDEGSQIAALLAAARPGEQVVDLCAGAGGKTLALAAAMAGKGQIHATDNDKRRLAPIHETAAASRRAQCAGAHAKGRRFGARTISTAAWTRADRRAVHRYRRPGDAYPDAKWRVRPGALDTRGLKEQAAALDRAASLVKLAAHRLHHVIGA